MFEIVESRSQKAIIKVVGVGGCGGNAVDHMIEKNVMGVEFMCINTDLQALKKSQASSIIQIGETLTKGLGAGSRPDTGKQAAIDDKEKIIEATQVADGDQAMRQLRYEQSETVPSAAEEAPQYSDSEELRKQIKVTKKAMESAAKELDFIEAARLRDRLFGLEKQIKK